MIVGAAFTRHGFGLIKRGADDSYRFVPLSINPRKIFFCGVIAGITGGYNVSLLAFSEIPVQAWLTPGPVLSVLTMIFSVGMAWQLVAEDRRRIATLEADSVRKEVFGATILGLSQLVQSMDKKLDRLIGEDK